MVVEEGRREEDEGNIRICAGEVGRRTPSRWHTRSRTWASRRVHGGSIGGVEKAGEKCPGKPAL